MRELISIHHFADVRGLLGVEPGINAVFFEASNTQSFSDPGARAAFRERWLGRYLTHYPEWAYVAMNSDKSVAGYLVASLDDPASTPRFSDIHYFATFKDLTHRFPAHLHVNLASGSWGAGIGTALMARFVADARRAGVPGVHIVTSRGARNVGFYTRNGFREAGAMGEGTSEVVFLAREL